MIDTANYGRLSEGLLIYQVATQQFIARTLQTANNGAGDWFRDLVLPSLRGGRRENLERDLNKTEDQFRPERLLDANHFPHVIDRNWSQLRQGQTTVKSMQNWMRGLNSGGLSTQKKSSACIGSSGCISKRQQGKQH